MSINHTVFIPIFVFSMLLFVYGCYQRLGLVWKGAREDRSGSHGERLAGMFAYAFGQKRVLARPFGMNHFILFWAFMLLLIANTEFLLEGLIPGASLAALPLVLQVPLGFLFDVVSLIALLSVGVALARRFFFAPDYLGNDHVSPRGGEALLILGMIAILMLAFFLLHGARIALGEGDVFRPFSAFLGRQLTGASESVLQGVAVVSWWVHALVLLAFMNLLPRSKHMHILTAIPNTYLRSLEKPNAQPRETFRKGEIFGVGKVDQFTWKDLLDSLTCTECGRCQDLCPAHSTGKPLNPRRVVHDIKVNLLKSGSVQGSALPLIAEEPSEGTVGEEAVWSCTTCGACLAVCPVLIEQMPKIVKMRRHLVEEKARFPEELLNFFENIEQRSNPWGIAPAERQKWSSLFGEKTFDAKQCEYLFFVGCAGAFDNRAKQVTVAVASLLDTAGVSWGTLGKEELCCGESVRRLGNEYLFDQLAQQNVALLREKGVRKIVTSCPHCFSTLKNDYRQYGLRVEVLHHSEVLEALIGEGRLKVTGRAEIGPTLFHDSCYLGRHNDTYAPPRNVLEAATGQAPEEFKRQGESAFCCGAGGGRMWMEEQTGTRINHERVRQALQKNPKTLCVSCPFCMTMLEDGLKDKGQSSIRVRDIAEVLAEAVHQG